MKDERGFKVFLCHVTIDEGPRKRSDRLTCIRQEFIGAPGRSISVELSDKDSKTIGESMEETKEYHVRYLRAVNNPLRRDILRAMKDGEGTLEALGEKTGLEAKALEWHLDILEHGFCVEKEERDGKVIYVLTQEGMVVDYVDK